MPGISARPDRTAARPAFLDASDPDYQRPQSVSARAPGRLLFASSRSRCWGMPCSRRFAMWSVTDGASSACAASSCCRRSHNMRHGHALVVGTTKQRARETRRSPADQKPRSLSCHRQRRTQPASGSTAVSNALAQVSKWRNLEKPWERACSSDIRTCPNSTSSRARAADRKITGNGDVRCSDKWSMFTSSATGSRESSSRSIWRTGSRRRSLESRAWHSGRLSQPEAL